MQINKISIDAEKALDKIQHLFIIKSPEESRNRRNISQQTLYNKPVDNITPSQKNKPQSISTKVRKSTRVFYFLLP